MQQAFSLFPEQSTLAIAAIRFQMIRPQMISTQFIYYNRDVNIAIILCKKLLHSAMLYRHRN
jgi:hypothetical protein